MPIATILQSKAKILGLEATSTKIFAILSHTSINSQSINIIIDLSNFVLIKI